MNIRSAFGLFALSILLIGALTPATSAQGSAADFARAKRVGSLARGKVVGERLELTWSQDDENVTWFRPLPGGGREYFKVQASDGVVERAFDHEAVAVACKEAGLSVSASDLPLQGLEFTDDGELALLLHAGEDVLIVMTSDDEALIVAAEPEGPFSLAPCRRGRTTRGTTQASQIIFVNTTEIIVRLEWVDTGGKRKSYGKVHPGQTLLRKTRVGHMWELLDEAGESLAFFESERGARVAFVPAGRVQFAPEKRSRRNRDEHEPRPRHGRFSFRDDKVTWTDADGDLTTELSLPAGYEGATLKGPANTSPDGRFAVLYANTPGEDRQVQFVESSPKNQLQPKLHTFGYEKPGDARRQHMPLLFEAATRTVHAIDDALFKNPWSIRNLKWAENSERFFFRYNARGHQILRWVSVEAATRKVTSVIEDVSETFLDYSQKGYFRHFTESGEILWMSERSGFNHLYRFDAQSGELLNAVTSGDWVLREIERIDEEEGMLWFRAMGVYPEQDPYHVHYGRVRLDGSELTWLTQGDGMHSLTYSSEGGLYLDTYSRVDMAPVHELRRTRDGSLVAQLGRADATALADSGLSLPERFAAPGRDGSTAIWGLILRPTNFDAARKYPIIEYIYAGPHGAHVPKSFRAFHRLQTLAELGFVIVQIDGMGTNWRSKAFHDVAWKNLKDAGFPDRIAWMRAAAETRPWMDLDHVGIYGGSAGGQNAMRAVLDHHDFYRAAAADCGCHDNRMDKVWWNEAWMGWPIDESYAASSNAVDAHKLGAPLLLTVGELDRNVDPASTMQVVSALIKADKDFDLIVFPGAGHGAGGGRYGDRRRRDFFVRHLMGVEPRWE